MPGGRGGGHDSVGAKITALEQQLRDLRRQTGCGAGDAPPRASGGRNEGGDAVRGHGGGGGGRSPMRPGDWVCIACGAKPCWARTTSCFKCGEPRPRGGGAGGGGGKGAAKGSSAAVRRDDYLGPRGANGSRPLLGGRAAPQSSAGLGRGQPMVGATPKRDAASVGGKGSQGKGRPPPVVDADGFRTVTADRQSRPKVDCAPASDGPAVAAAAASAPTSWAELVQRTTGSATQHARADDADGDPHALDDGGMAIDEDDGQRRTFDGGPCDQHFDDDGGDEEGDEEADDDAGGMAGATEEELRKVWEDSRDACRMLERNPRTPAAIVAAARRERDQAEADWRSSRRPHPLHKRMRWAQRAYDAAVLKQQAHQQELDEFEEETARKRRVLLERAQVDKDRTARKLQALEDVLQGGDPRPPSDALQAAQVAANGIAKDLGPALAAVADKLPDTSMAWIELQAAMSTLAAVEDVLRGTIRPQQQPAADASRPAQYDISDGPAGADAAQMYDDTGGCEGRTTVGTGGGGGPTRAPSAHPTCAAAEVGKPTAAAGGAPKWKGPRTGDNRWGGHVWKKQRDDQTCTVRGLSDSTADDGGTTGASSSTQLSSLHAKEQAAKLLAAQAKEREAAEAVKLQAEEALRLQQVQQEQQRQATADAAAAAEALRQAQRAMAEAEAQEAARQELERRALVARTDPEELRRAQELHAQQSAIAAAGFGTAQAVAEAGLLQAAAPRNQTHGDGGMDEDAARIMEMSPEELAELQRGSMDVGRCPW